ncbi:TPA: 5-methylcytosine-specific endonuclease McrA, partial [Escherichia coli]
DNGAAFYQNCHRELHYSKNEKELIEMHCVNINRLQK